MDAFQSVPSASTHFQIYEGGGGGWQVSLNYPPHCCAYFSLALVSLIKIGMYFFCSKEIFVSAKLLMKKIPETTAFL